MSRFAPDIWIRPARVEPPEPWHLPRTNDRASAVIAACGATFQTDVDLAERSVHIIPLRDRCKRCGRTLG